MPSQVELDFRAEQATRASGGGQSQNAKLRAYLIAHPHRWLPMPDLAAHIGAYAVHSRIADLRSKFSMTIHHKNERLPNGQTASFYQYLPQTPDSPPG